MSADLDEGRVQRLTRNQAHAHDDLAEPVRLLVAGRGDHGALVEVDRAPHRTRDHRQDSGASGGVDEVDHVDHEGGVLDDRVQESAPSPPLATAWQSGCVLGE